MNHLRKSSQHLQPPSNVNSTPSGAFKSHLSTLRHPQKSSHHTRVLWKVTTLGYFEKSPQHLQAPSTVVSAPSGTLQSHLSTCRHLQKPSGDHFVGHQCPLVQSRAPKATLPPLVIYQISSQYLQASSKVVSAPPGTSKNHLSTFRHLQEFSSDHFVDISAIPRKYFLPLFV